MGTYTLDDVARITGVSRARLRYWERTALLEPAVARDSGDSRCQDSEFEFGDLVTVRSVLSLLGRGVSLRRIRRSFLKKIKGACKITEINLPKPDPR